MEQENIELSPEDITAQIAGFQYAIDMAKNDPQGYMQMYNGLISEERSFIRFLREKAAMASNPVEKTDPGNVTIVTFSRSKGTTDPLIIVENARGTGPVKKSLCAILNELESSFPREGFFVAPNAVGGARFESEGSELSIVMRKA